MTVSAERSSSAWECRSPCVRRRRTQLFFFLQIIIIVTDIINKLLTGQFQNPCGRLVDKITVMTDKQNRPGVVDKGILQDLSGIYIKMVGRLVQNQKVGVGEHQLCEGNSASFTTA